MAGIDHVQKVTVENASGLPTIDRVVQLAVAPLHPFGQGLLTANGVQWSPEVSTTDGEWTEIESVTVSLGLTDAILEIELALTLSLKSTGATKDAKLKWQARNSAGTWVDLCAEETYAASAAAYKEYTFSGRFVPVANFNTMPIDIRAVVQREDATEEVTAKVKNSSYVIIVI